MIDYNDARKRIMLAFCRGVIRKYGVRRMVKHKRIVERPGRFYWAKDELWVDPGGVKRRGRMMRAPSEKVEAEIEIPQGVVPNEILDYADAVADAFVETLRIAEEAGVRAPSSELEQRPEGE